MTTTKSSGVWPEPPGWTSMWDAYTIPMRSWATIPLLAGALYRFSTKRAPPPPETHGSSSARVQDRRSSNATLRTSTTSSQWLEKPSSKKCFFDEAYFDQALANYEEWTTRPDAAILVWNFLGRGRQALNPSALAQIVQQANCIPFGIVLSAPSPNFRLRK